MVTEYYADEDTFGTLIEQDSRFVDAFRSAYRRTETIEDLRLHQMGDRLVLWSKLRKLEEARGLEVTWPTFPGDETKLTKHYY